VYRPDIGGVSRQVTLAKPVATGEEIYAAALPLLAARDRQLLIGTLGVGISGLSRAGGGQLDLFASPAALRDARVELAMDAIRDRFGEDAVQRARLLGRARVVRDRIAFGNTGHPEEP
jgi:DNA polymerase-4